MGFVDGRVLRVVLRAVDSDQREYVNVLHYDLHDESGQPDNDPQSLADTFRDDVIGPYRGLFRTDVTVDPVSIIEERDPLNPFAARSSWTSGTSLAGTRSPTYDLLPRQVCAVATLKTARIGRRYRGRLFLPGQFDENDQTNGSFNSFATVRLGVFLAAIPRQPDIGSGPSSSSAHWSVYSRTQREQNLNPYLSPVTDAVLRLPLHWLRSRATQLVQVNGSFPYLRVAQAVAIVLGAVAKVVSAYRRRPGAPPADHQRSGGGGTALVPSADLCAPPIAPPVDREELRRQHELHTAVDVPQLATYSRHFE